MWSLAALGAVVFSTLAVAASETFLLSGAPASNLTAAFPSGLLHATAPSALTGGLWGSSASLGTARQDFKAVLLQNGSLSGQVLAIGGCCSPSGSLSGSELFNPAQNSWLRTGDLQRARWLFQAVDLKNGSALAVGGLGIANGGVLSSAEIFIPTANGSSPFGFWQEVAGMNIPRQDFELVRLGDGRVMALGGFMASTEIYDPEKNMWTISAPMADARSSFQALALASGRVLAIGGRGRETGALSSTELFDPVSGSWSQQGNLQQGRAYFAAVELPSGSVMVAGGKDSSGQNLNSSEIYDPKTGKWTSVAGMNYQRSDLQAVALQSGQTLVVGGLGGRSSGEISILDTAEVFDPSMGAWTLTNPMLDARYVFQLVTLANSSVMALGGTGVRGYTASTEIFGSS